VRALPGLWRTGELDPDQLGTVGACWNAVARMTADYGVELALHVDFLSAMRTIDDVGALLERTEAGLALDTAELAVADIDPVAVAQRYGPRVRHVHLKDARDKVGEDARTANAEKHVLLGGGRRGVERWFWELGEGSVDVTGVVAALRDHGYAGWWIVESDQSPSPPESALLNAWVVQRTLARR
jgi:inosose dehydratase